MASSSARVLSGSIYVMTAGDFKVPALQQNGSSCLRLEQLLSNKTNRKTAVERRASVLITHSTQVFFRCLLCNCCWLAVCIVAVVLCVLLSYVNLLYLRALFFFYFRYRTAGYKSGFGRSCDRPHRHRFFLVSLCRKANAEMVPNIPSCHYMPLM